MEGHLSSSRKVSQITAYRNVTLKWTPKPVQQRGSYPRNHLPGATRKHRGPIRHHRRRLEQNEGVRPSDPEQDRSAISASGGQGDAAVSVNTLQRPGYSPGWCTLLTTTTLLSEGVVLAVVVRDFHETPHQKRDNTDCPRLMRQSEARLRLARSPSPGAVARRARRGHAARRNAQCRGASLPNVIHWGWRGAPAPSNPRPGGTPPAPPSPPPLPSPSPGNFEPGSHPGLHGAKSRCWACRGHSITPAR